ncbi:MAG: anaerobic sulfite reductase subunit AsrA [Clostridiales bacterium]|nr:anaerobic sulfite reductase subunit AsrA [Clostridiales bacterium]
MGYSLNIAQADALLSALAKDYRVYAPRRFRNQGRYSATDVIRYGEVGKFSEIVWQQKSDYPAKEVINPIQQALFYFTEDEYRESKGPAKPVLILARPCDINAQRVQAKIFAGNGGFTDVYYERMREKVRFAMMECNGGDDTCFCVSMGSNKTDEYSLAFRFSEEGLDAEVKDPDFAAYFAGMPQSGYTPSFVEENELKVTVPDLEDKAVRQALKKHLMWKEFDGRCISCGACTVACSTCTCFTTRDIIYGDNPEVGERRRVTASCQIAGFDQMAGQKEFRATAGDRMRYKVLHKFHDYKVRFGESHMCVGCGRCTHRCPEMISISATVNKMNAAVSEIKSGMAKQ